MAQPHTAAAVLRQPHAAEIETLKRLWFMSSGEYSAQVTDVLASVADGEYHGNPRQVPFRRASGTRGTLHLLYRMTTADRNGKAVGVSYVGNPISWMNYVADWSVADMSTMAARINEVQALAVEPRYRRKGIGRMLLDDAETQLRDTGHRLAMVCLRDTGDYTHLRAWYTRCGYTFGPGTPAEPAPPGTAWQVQPRTTEERAFGFERGGMPVHAIGFKTLHPAVQVHAATPATPPTVTGLLDEDA